MVNNFFKNISRYPRFLITSTFGSILIILTPFKNLLQKTQSRFILIFIILVILINLHYIISNMLGL